VARTHKRIPAAERRQKVVEATLRIMAFEGIQGATTARIAAASGVSEGTLYRLFGNKTGILLATLDAVYKHFFEVIACCDEEDPLERLRVIGRRHSAIMIDSRREHHTNALFAFIGAPASAGLTQAVAERQQKVLDLLAGIVEEGKSAGSIPENVDPYMVAWVFVSIYWAEDISSLLGLPGFLLEGRSKRMADCLLRCFVTCSKC